MRSTSKLMKRLKLKEADASELESELVRRSEGSFLWVTLAFDLLGRARGLTANKLKALVYRIPSGLNQIYDSMLNKLVEESTTALDEGNLMTNIREVETLCGAFVEIVPAQMSAGQSSEPLADTVCQIHQSAKDYLLDALFKLKEPLSKFRIDPQQGHVEIARQCLTHLMFDLFGNEKPPGFNSLDARTAYKTDGDDSYERMLIQKKIRLHPFLEFQRPGSKVSSIKYATSYALHITYETSLWVRLFFDKLCQSTTLFSRLTFAATFGLVDAVQKLLERPGININKADALGRTPLAAVAITASSHPEESVAIARLLLYHGPRSHPVLRTVMTHLSIVWPTLVHLNCANCSLKKALAKSSLMWGIMGYAACIMLPVSTESMFCSYCLRKPTKISRSLPKGAKRHCTWPAPMDRWGGQIPSQQKLQPLLAALPLHCFVECNHRNVAEVLLAAGAKVNLRTPGTAESPETKHSRAGATAVRPVLNVSTALHQATAYNNPDPMKLLLKYGADINATTDQAEHTPLPLAIMFGCSDAVALLLEKGANIEVYAVGPPEGTPLIYAIKDIVQQLLRQGADVEAKWELSDNCAIHAAVTYLQQHHMGVLEQIAQVANLESVSKYGHTALSLAASWDEVWSFEVLIAAGMVILAVKSIAVGAVKCLLKNGADAETRNDDGENALMCAADEGFLEIIKVLVNFGVKIYDDGLGARMLAIAVATNDVEAVRMHCKQNHHFPGLQRRQSSSASEEVPCFTGRAELVQLLLDRGMPCDSLDHNGWTPWWLAKQQQYHKTRGILKEKSEQPSVSPLKRFPSRWVTFDGDDGVQLSEDGLLAEFPDGLSRNLDKGSGFVADVCVPNHLEDGPFYFEWDNYSPATRIETPDIGHLDLLDIGFSLEITRPNWYLGFDTFA
ncbi:ankyrin repeat-containing domain protein [Sphaerosporella brunnea]|uniref:Ankyrin repeat-containing domain protein n=1 Tax=Sphaerosporella brunnea TaxID=1250544 RepID=A0A5J5FCB4_9PEZI|nr:ankyrin repeat-containing domain protein [Sphaerosporella brunnea]